MKIIDISMEIKPGMLTYPGNPHPQIETYSHIPKDRTNESRMTLGTHTGTHVDAVYHVRNKSETALDFSLDHFYGPCRVLDLTHAGQAIEARHLEPLNLKKYEIILLKTENSLHQYEDFREDFAYVSPSGARLLVEKRIRTLGIDYLSVKKFHADHEVHEMLIENLALIEGLDLRKADPGKYTLSAFPLKIRADGAPVRAVLIQNF